MTQLEIGGRLGGEWEESGGRVGREWEESGGGLGGDWVKIGGRLGEEMACLALFFVILGRYFFCFGARLTFCEQLATRLVPRQGSQGSTVRVFFVFSLTKNALV